MRRREICLRRLRALVSRCGGRGSVMLFISIISISSIMFLGILFRRRLSAHAGIFVWVQPEDCFEWPVEVGREPERQLDGRHITPNFERENRVPRDLQIGGKLLLRQPMLLAQLAQAVDDTFCHSIELSVSSVVLSELNVKHT